MTLPTKTLDEDSLPVYMNKQLGTPLTGDGELHLLAGMPLRVQDLVSFTKISAAAPVVAGTIPPAEVTAVEAVITKRKGGKS